MGRRGWHGPLDDKSECQTRGVSTSMIFHGRASFLEPWLNSPKIDPNFKVGVSQVGAEACVAATGLK